MDNLISRKRNDIATKVYQKSTCNDIYLNWNAFAQATWKRGTLKTLVERACVICSTDQLLQRKLKYLEKVFHKKNNYPKYIVKQILENITEQNIQPNIQPKRNNIC